MTRHFHRYVCMCLSRYSTTGTAIFCSACCSHLPDLSPSVWAFALGGTACRTVAPLPKDACRCTQPRLVTAGDRSNTRHLPCPPRSFMALLQHATRSQTSNQSRAPRWGLCAGWAGSAGAVVGALQSNSQTKVAKQRVSVNLRTLPMSSHVTAIPMPGMT